MNRYLTFEKLSILAIILFAFIFYGCDISDSHTSNNSSQDLSDEELELAGQILAESLSDQKDGIFASLNDAFTLPSSDNLVPNNAGKAKFSSAAFNSAMAKNSGQAENSYSYNYNPDSGTHLVNFNRSIHNENFSKESSAELRYTYFDIDNSYIYSPRLDNDKIETIDYKGIRTGSIVTPNQNSAYERHDNFFIEGLTSSGILTIEGLHEGSGEFKVTRENGDVIERNYTLTIEFLNVQLQNQSVSSNQTLQNGVEGALAYEMVISKNINGSESLKTINGTIEFNGDGTALLRFQNIVEGFKVKIEEGSILADDEFDGYVESVNTEAGNESFTLKNEAEPYLFGTDTEIDPDGDLTTLEEVESTIAAGVRVEAEGTYVTNTDDAKIVQSVKFEYEEEDLEFDDMVDEVSTDEDGSISLVDDDRVLNLNESTVISPEGDLMTLEDVAWALNNGFMVKAEGDLVLETDGSFTITEVKFEYEGEDDFEFDDDVESVNTTDQTFTLADGEMYQMDENTEIHKNSDFSTLEEVEAAILGGSEVDAEGDYAPQPDGTLLVTKVKFDSNDEGGDDNGEDGDDDGDTEDYNGPTEDMGGHVESADASSKTMVVSGTTFRILKSTKFDDGIQSLGNLVGALQRGDKVYAQVEYYTENGQNFAVEIEFDVERHSDSNGNQQKFKFESNVSSVDLANQTFELRTGLILSVDSETEFEDGDLFSLEELDDALSNGDEVEAEGRYYIDDASDNIVIKVELKIEKDDNGDDGDKNGDDDGDDNGDNGGNNDGDNFNGKVGSIDTFNRSFTLKNKRTYFINDDTIFDEDGDFLSLEEAQTGLQNGDNVKVEGEYAEQNDGTFLVLNVKFQIGDDDDGDDGDDDPEEFSLEGLVTSATTTSFTLSSGTYIVNDENVIKGGDIESMQDLIDALNNGKEVDADGEYYIDSNGDNIVIEVEFEINDDGEDDGDDDEHEKFDLSGLVTSATSTSFTLSSGTYIVNDEDAIKGGDIESMQDLIDALNEGKEVDADGEYYIDSNGDNIVVEVEFEINDDNGDDDGDSDGDDEDGDDEDPEKLNFNGAVSSATSSSFILNSETYLLDEDSNLIGKVKSMQEVMDALDNGDDVDANGDYYINDSGEYIIIKVKFDIKK